jgi:hypothetical protein
MPQRKTIPLRMSPRLVDALRRWAEEDFRSLNGQIEWLCHEALRRAGRLPGGDAQRSEPRADAQHDTPPGPPADEPDAS